MEEQPIYPTKSKDIESEIEARRVYASYQRSVEVFGLASEEQFKEAQRVRDLGVLDPATGLYLVFKAFSQWIGNVLPRDDWSTDEQAFELLEAEGESALVGVLHEIANSKSGMVE